MRKLNIRVLTGTGAVFSLATFAASTDASVTLNNPTVGSSTNFPTMSANGGTLTFNDVLTTPAGATIAGGAAQGMGTNATGEIFTGVSGVLSAISLISTGADGTSPYQPFLFNLGATGPYNAPSDQFNPSTQTNLFNASDSITEGGTGTEKFIEMDFAGADTVTLVAADSYAFGLYATTSDNGMTILRDSGTQSDPNGDGYTFATFASTSDNAAPFSGSVRNLFIGVYTTPVPEPASFSLIGLGGLALLFRRRQLTA